MGSMHRLLRAYVDGISSLKKQGVCAKEKAQVDLVYPMLMWKELERVFNAVRALKPSDKLKRLEFSIFMQEAMQDGNFASRLVFSDEASSHSSDELKNRITTAAKSITKDMLQEVWNEFVYRLDVIRVTKGAHMGHL
ncbi:Hypothetical protein CINCED_3A025381 [Cinara cedri]|uniref:Uncharacterized protein n=1 Tax=Cinara cedri TaxID=506608 RepID=A0A5E4NIS9_9HEMI|nr:Hypothetical protein CINCED_3A025381 [Cinara cedri]